MSRSLDWLKRQSRDPFVQERIKRGLNSRSAFKLEHLDEKLKFITKNKKVVDLGACPGGWTQVLLERGVKDIVAVDLRDPPANLKDKAKFIVGDFTLPAIRTLCLQAMDGKQAVSLCCVSSSTCVLHLVSTLTAFAKEPHPL
jgi:23S rRNA (uridine2552-2'-O)-methyltransferase